MSAPPVEPAAATAGAAPAAPNVTLYAVPFTFRPGYRICFHYDGEDETGRDMSATTGGNVKYTTRDGVVDQVTYTFNLTKTGATEAYTCKADVVASLSMEKTEHLEGFSVV